MRQFLIILGASLAVILLVNLWGVIVKEDARRDLLQDQRSAYQVCDRAHFASTITQAQEDACQKLLDATNTTYLCDETGASCYLEVR